MTLWLVMAGMTLATLAALLWPLLQPPAAGGPARASDRAIYRDQLIELERDVERGLVTAEQAAGMRLEIERRLLAAAGPGHAPAASAPSSRVWISAMALAVLLPLGAGSLYLSLGAPKMPGRPIAERPERAEAISRTHEINAMVTRLEQRLGDQPNDGEGWAMLGRSYMFLERYTDAANAFRRALGLGGATAPMADINAAFGEALMMAAGGEVTALARQAFEAALRLDPEDARARFYLALASEQAGDVRRALDDYVALARRAPPDATWLGAVRERIDDAARKLGVDAAALLPATPSPAPSSSPSPSPRMEALAGMTPAERENFMRERVAALAERLTREPEDAEGWRMLGRSYAVMGRHGDSRAAYGEALKRKPDDVELLAGFAESAVNAAGGNIAPAEAVAAFRRLLALLPPGSPEFAQAEARLKALTGGK